jgi:alkanesulfonate monooxygenase SsuD/methylene tetrahydromethanopterin reductase-like flavin-dependent oxidoreductase (luciferase family)
MDFGIDIAQQRVTFAEVVNRTQLAERLGFTGAWGFDHFVPMYGEGPGECFEGMTTLAALASATSRVRLGMLVTGVTYRHPSLFAAQALTIDHASNGRFDLALGAAWAEQEHRQLGIEFPPTPARFDLLEDTLEIVTRLYSGERVSYQGRRVSLDNAQMRPLPVQRPRPPIWIGGSGRKRTLPLVARFADVWHPAGATNYADLSIDLERLAAAEGRNAADIRRATSLSLSEPWGQVRAAIEKARDQGFSYLICGWPGEGADRVTEFAETVLVDYGATDRRP